MLQPNTAAVITTVLTMAHSFSFLVTTGNLDSCFAAITWIAGQDLV